MIKALTILLLFNAATSIAQPGRIPAANKTGIVDLLINNNSTVGCGFITGGTKDSLFIATARHVVMSNGNISQDIKVALNDNALIKGNVLFVAGDTGDLYDIALIGIALTNRQLPEYATITNINLGTDVFYYRSKGALLLPQTDAGSIVNWEDEDHKMYSIYLGGIIPGDSGSALFSTKGITGMIIAQDGYYGSVLNINHIKKVICNWNSKYWQLRERE